jgi:hypothetical protein
VVGVLGEYFEREIANLKRERGVSPDTELDTGALQQLVATFRGSMTFQRIRGHSSTALSGPYSSLGMAREPRPIDASTASPKSGVPRSISSRWCSETKGRRRAPGSRSVAMR